MDSLHTEPPEKLLLYWRECKLMQDQTVPPALKVRSPNHWIHREFRPLPSFAFLLVQGGLLICVVGSCSAQLDTTEGNLVFLPGEFHGQRSLMGYRVTQELDMTEQLTLQHTQGSTVLRLGNPEQNTQKCKFIAVSNRQDLTLRPWPPI